MPASQMNDNQSTDELEVMRNKLKTNGWHWLPGQGKGIYYDGWNKGEYSYDAAEYQASENPAWANTAILQDQSVARDVDAKVPSTAAKLAEPALLGESPCGTRYGSKGSAKLYGVVSPMRSITVRGIAPGDTKKSTISEYIGKTRQLMCFGIHPDTGKQYRWDGKSPCDVPVSKFTKYSREDFMAQAVKDKEIVEADGWTDVTISVQATDDDKAEAREGNGGLVDRAMLEKMLSHIDPGQDHNSLLPVIGALKHAEACELVCDPDTLEPDSEFSMEATVIAWARGDYWKDGTPGNYADGWAEKRWESMYPFKQGGAKFGTLVTLARAGGYKGHSRIDDLLSQLPPGDDSNVIPFPANTAAHSEFATFEELYDPWREFSAPQFPLETLPPAVRNYVVMKAEEIGVDVSAIAMSCMTAMSGALTHDAMLFLKAGENYPVSCRMWTLLVAPPSGKKTPAQLAAIGHLWKVDQARDAAHGEKVRAILEDDSDDKEKKKKLALLNREAPAQLIANDMTVEKFADITSRQDRGLFVNADELSGWIGAHDRYNSGKGASADRAMWLKAYDGGPYRLQRMGRPTVPVKNLSASLLGGIQPDRLMEISGLQSDGLLQRFLPVMMRRPTLGKNIFDAPTKEGWEKLLNRLIAHEAFKVRLSPGAFFEFERMERDLFHLGLNDSEGVAFSSFVGKLLGMWGSLCLLLHVAWDGVTLNQVSADTAKLASRIVEEFILPHGLLFYRSLFEGAQSDHQAIGAFIQGHHSKGHPAITGRDFRRGPKATRDAKVRLPDKLMSFTSGGWLTPENEGPWCNSWTINPAVAGFEAEAKQHRLKVQELQKKIQVSATANRPDAA